ncbi:3,5-epimerase/4-reductase [Fistulifera solaris]|uniref:3,5-epimerase/4-reductase n=1 Tax=Fistulifera solaris TaxID=1519565 RepID=A0A1Z5KT21_FISSO|nr:3,5-epimerase/4-reductase [Fistulifera solaris]|eukprot:GAX29474.1 3,5-epimerase/4-reductase [Fistulifera solaris]
MTKVLIYGGKTGWIGGKMYTLCKEHGIEVYNADSRIENREAVAAELDRIQPSHVLMSAGITGRPNIDWCEDHRPETIRTNVIGTLNVADLCNERGIHCTVYATGCIYTYDAAHPLGSGIGFTEEDKPNFTGSFYSETKSYVEPLLKQYPTCMILRVRMPISDDLSSRSFVTKIAKYEKVVNIPNSMTVLTELLPASLKMAQKGLTGIYNFTNPGVISHNQVLDLYKKYIDPDFQYSNFTIEEQNEILKAPRSNNELDTTKLLRDTEGIEINDILTAMDLCFQRMKKNLEAEGILPDNLPKEFKHKVHGGTGESLKK